MRNKYPGICYRCGKPVSALAGHFEKHHGTWRVQHAQCAIDWRGTNQTYSNQAKVNTNAHNAQ